MAQILGYLRASRVEHGLLINFGAPKCEIKKWHPSQQLRQRRDGTLELRIQTSSRKELTRWILSWMLHVRVLAPRQLQERVRERMRQGLAQCR